MKWTKVVTAPNSDELTSKSDSIYRNDKSNQFIPKMGEDIVCRV